MKSDDIIKISDTRSKNRAKQQAIHAKLYKVEDNKILYTVTSSTGRNQYIVTIQLMSLTHNKLRSLRSALSSNLRIHCSCPAFLFQGYKYIAYKKNVGIEPENRSPDITNPNKEGLACKHILVVLEQLKADYSKIYELFKQQTTRYTKSSSDNKSSLFFTDEDLDILKSFKDSCDSLYNNFTEFLKSSDNISEFVKNYSGQVPSNILLNLSKPAAKLVSSSFIGRLKSIDHTLDLIKQKKNGFNILVKSDIDSVTRKINSKLKTTTESLINNIIFSIIGD